MSVTRIKTAVAVDHLRSIRWRDSEFCPYCGDNRVYHFADRKTHKCGACRQRFSIKVGAIFEDTKLPLRKWLAAIWMITNLPKGIASTTLAKDLKITQKSAWYVQEMAWRYNRRDMKPSPRMNSLFECI